MLKLIKIDDITLDINHLGIYNQLILDFNLSAQDKINVADALMIKDKVQLRKILNKHNKNNSKYYKSKY